MSDEANAPSNGAPSDVAQVSDAGQAAPAEAPVSQASESEAPASSPREALERAFKAVDAEQPASRARAANGQFAPANTAEALAAEQAQAQALTAAQIEHPGLTKEAQALWNATPEALRTDVMRRVNELTQGIEKYKPYKGDAEAFAEIREYADLAKQHGTTLKAALTNYHGIEKLLANSPFEGILRICQNTRIDPGALAQALFQYSQGQPYQQQPQQSQEVIALVQHVANLEGRLQQINQTMEEQRLAPVVTNIQKAAEQKPYFDILQPHIISLLESGGVERTGDPVRDLEAAYDATLKRFPQLVAAVEADKAAKAAQDRKLPDPAQTREKALKSITGSPSSASSANTRKPAGSAREAVANAFAQVGLA